MLKSFLAFLVVMFNRYNIGDFLLDYRLFTALDITVKSIDMLEFFNPDIIIGCGGGLGCAVDGVPNFEDINTDLFPKGFFSQVAFDYLDDNWGNGYDMEDTVANWINDEDKEHWYDIKKTEDGDYYYVAGDQTGVVYYGQIDTIKVVFEDYDLRFNEDDDYYYIQFQDKDGEYSKADYTLESAILDMKRILEES